MLETPAAPAAPAAEPKWPRVVTLKHPFDFGSERVTSLEFRRGRLGDLKGMQLSDNVPMAHLTMIASRLSGRPVAMIEMIDADDAGEVTDIALDFYGKCLGTGRKA